MTESNKNIFVLDNDNKNNSNSAVEKWQQYLQRMLLVTAS